MKGRVLSVAFLLCAAAPASAEDNVFDSATGYRTSAYRAIVPRPPPGVRRIGVAEVAKLADAKRAILIDVVPAEGGVRGPDSHWRLAREEHGIPGAHWFPEAGRGVIDPAIARWFLAGVTTLRAKQPRAPLIVFCLADCWMSWNAAWRLKRAGFADVRWFGEGADGWRDRGRRLVPMTPYGD